jgi:GNAT superfamily N-acetyltransferase
MLQAYDRQLRGEVETVGAHSTTRLGPLWLAVFDGMSGFVGYQHLAGLEGAALDELIEQAVAHFRDATDVAEVEWKTRGHDAPPDLPDHLIAHGFAPEEAETVMVGEAAQLGVEVGLPDGVVVRRAGVGGDLADDVERAHQLAERVFSRSSGRSTESQVEDLRKSAHLASLWIAEAGDTVVSAGRLVIVEETDFAGLWAGVTHPDWRRRGIYRALTAARAHHAVESGVTYLQSDCTPMSRPILERAGLEAVTTTTPYLWKRG